MAEESRKYRAISMVPGLQSAFQRQASLRQNAGRVISISSIRVSCLRWYFAVQRDYNAEPGISHAIDVSLVCKMFLFQEWIC